MDPFAYPALLFVVTVATIVLVFFIFWLRLAAEMRLVAIGVVLALCAVWYGLLIGMPIERHGGSPLAQVASSPDLAIGLLKLAVVLVLGGIVTGLLARGAVSVPPTFPERPHDVPPNA